MELQYYKSSSPHMPAFNSNIQLPKVADSYRMFFGFIHSVFEWAVTQKKATLRAEARHCRTYIKRYFSAAQLHFHSTWEQNKPAELLHNKSEGTNITLSHLHLPELIKESIVNLSDTQLPKVSPVRGEAGAMMPQ